MDAGPPAPDRRAARRGHRLAGVRPRRVQGRAARRPGPDRQPSDQHDGSRRSEKPIEAQILPEPFTAGPRDEVELGLTFFQIIAEAFAANPIAPPTSRTRSWPSILRVEAGRTRRPADFESDRRGNDRVHADDAGSHARRRRGLRGRQGRDDPRQRRQPADRQPNRTALTGSTRPSHAGSKRRSAQIGSEDPKGWNANRLDYDIKMRFGAAPATVTLEVHPNENGSVDWTSFDLQTTTNQPFDDAARRRSRARSRRTRASRACRRRASGTSRAATSRWPDVDVDADRAGASAGDRLRDALRRRHVRRPAGPRRRQRGQRSTTLIVYDVFGGRVGRRSGRGGAHRPAPPIVSRCSPPRSQSAPPRRRRRRHQLHRAAAGRGARRCSTGRRWRRCASRATRWQTWSWGIEAVTESRIGERRRGSERDAARSTPRCRRPPRRRPTAPLRYQVESKVPVHWIPFLIPRHGPVDAAGKGGHCARQRREAGCRSTRSGRS